MRISDWSSDVCSSDLSEYSAGRSVRPWKLPLTTSRLTLRPACLAPSSVMALVLVWAMRAASETDSEPEFRHMKLANGQPPMLWPISLRSARSARSCDRLGVRSEEHTSELQSLMRISYAVFCLKKKKDISDQPDDI